MKLKASGSFSDATEDLLKLFLITSGKSEPCFADYRCTRGSQTRKRHEQCFGRCAENPHALRSQKVRLHEGGCVEDVVQKDQGVISFQFRTYHVLMVLDFVERQ